MSTSSSQKVSTPNKRDFVTQVTTGVNLVRTEGLLALYRGLNPAVARGLFYGGMRLYTLTLAYPPALFIRSNASYQQLYNSRAICFCWHSEDLRMLTHSVVGTVLSELTLCLGFRCAFGLLQPHEDSLRGNQGEQLCS